MDTNELRIGNWVNANFPSKCGNNYAEHKLRSGYEIDVFAPYAEPIPLTPEILDACGFKKEESPLNFPNPFRFLYSNKKCYVRFLDDKVFNIKIGDYIEERQLNLHELQNLFYALCHEELTVKLPVNA